MSPAVCAARGEHGHEDLNVLRVRRPHCAAAAGGDFMTIYLAAPGLGATPLRVAAADSVAAVKLRVQTARGVVVRRQKLVFDGRELARGECRVRDYGVGDGTVLHLVIRVADDLRLVTVETARGARFAFRVEPGRTVAHLKHRISSGSAWRPAEQRLLLLRGGGEEDEEEEELDDGRLVHDVCEGDVIRLLLVVCKAGGPEDLEETNQGIGIGTIEAVVVNPEAPLPPALEDLVRAVRAGMEEGQAPIMSSEGTGGAYLMQDASGERHVAVFKPADEEPMAANNPRGLPVSPTGEGLKKGTRVGEGALREVAAYLLDHNAFAGVPPTALVRCMHASFFSHQGQQGSSPPAFKLGSLQAFVDNCGSCEDMGPRAFPVQEVHKISVLDMRLANADRHAGNILVRKDDDAAVSLVPIDHGYCLPESFEDCTFEWLYWPQSREPFNQGTVEYIACLDAEEDIAVLRFHGWEISRQCARTLRVATMLLKKGAERGLTAFHIGSMMCRETLTKESAIEEMLRQAQAAAADHEDDFLQAVSQIMDRRLHHLSSDRK